MNAPAINEQQVQALLSELFEFDLHAKRVLSLSHAILGVIHSASLAVHTIGRMLAMARGLHPRHAIKQVDRLLSNDGVDVWKVFRKRVPFVLAERSEAVVALDWTDFEPDDQCTLVASLVTSHDRTTPLLWQPCSRSRVSCTQGHACAAKQSCASSKSFGWLPAVTCSFSDARLTGGPTMLQHRTRERALARGA